MGETSTHSLVEVIIKNFAAAHNEPTEVQAKAERLISGFYNNGIEQNEITRRQNLQQINYDSLSRDKMS